MQHLQNHLDTLVFPSPNDWKSFEHLLETLDHITIERLSRSQYISKGAHIYESYQGESGETYNRLSMPENVTHGELLFFIDFLTKKFGIEAYSKFDTILTKVKILVGWVIQASGEDGIQELRQIATTYHLDSDFVERLSAHILSLDAGTRSFIREIRRVTPGGVTGKTAFIEAGTQQLAQLLKQEFAFNFLRRGLEVVRMGMMTMTQEEQEKVMQKQEGDIRQHSPIQNLDVDERLLREKIGVDQFKQMLQVARISGDTADIEAIERKAVDRISQVIYEYPYQRTTEKHGYQLSRMIDTKELFCVGTSLLGHAFLSELGIQHKGVEELGHARLNVYIGDDIYMLDPSLRSEVQSIGDNNSGTEYNILHPDSKSGEVELISLAQIMNSKGLEFLVSGEKRAQECKYEEFILLLDNAIQMFELAIGFYPGLTQILTNKRYSLFLKNPLKL